MSDFPVLWKSRGLEPEFSALASYKLASYSYLAAVPLLIHENGKLKALL